MDKVDIVCLRTSPRPVPRIVRFVTVAKELGLTALYLGAKREKGLKVDDEINGIKVRRVGKFYPMLNGKSVLTYVWGSLFFNFSAFKFLVKNKPSIVHVSDIESFLSAFIYKIMYRKKIIYNIHDNFAQRYPLPNGINKILNLIEGVVVVLSDVSMAPEDFRISALPKFCQSKVNVVRNSPMNVDAFECLPINLKDEIVIVYSGWVDSKRGVDSLLRVADRIENLKVIVVGEGDPELIELMRRHPQCDFRGYIPYKDSIELLRNAHFVYIHYSPERIINRYAAPNKLSETLAVGRIPIVNSEIVLSQNVLENDCGIVTDYGDENALVDKILKIANDELYYSGMCKRARDLYEVEYSWEVVSDCTKCVIEGVICE